MTSAFTPQSRAILSRMALLFGHRANQILLVIWLAALAYCLANWHASLMVFILLGIGSQMFTEYLIHRFVFHLNPPRDQRLFNILYLCHYGHHDFPTNQGLFFVPNWFGLPMLAGGFLLYWGVLSAIGFDHALVYAVAMALIGNVTAFVIYEWYHMTAHLTVKKSAMEARVTRLHNQHHFRDFEGNYHVSFGGEIIDLALGTNIAIDHNARAEFIRTIGLDPADPRLLAARAKFGPRFGVAEAERTAASRGSKLEA